ncbi:hypothetical protein LshimejAT787_0111000 [Lyophyllum shimeji]|uniref:Uncharacterized protein n=1 Tax=Lyophyllum shimeji TaxID=47721 RepID=A0A9P3PEX3_LYOSH|nr:hypothetical protein LshimejAT787_0111000 [Lyophyllum shimeji]
MARYIVGISNIIIGLLLAFCLIMMVPTLTPPDANRAWRLFPVGSCSLGSAQCYSAWRGCQSSLSLPVQLANSPPPQAGTAARSGCAATRNWGVLYVGIFSPLLLGPWPSTLGAIID